MKQILSHVLPAVLFVVLLSPSSARSGATGTISGFVSDKETGKKLPGASVVIEGTNFGAMADKHGFYIIYNVPVGGYTLGVSMIGYVPMKLTNVQVKTDLNISANFALTSQVLEFREEIVVTAPRVQIPRDVLSSTQHFGEETIAEILPTANFYDVLPLVPGYVAHHFRGGRSYSAQYLIDGLPATSGYSREMAFMIPNSALAEMVVQTGGFGAEYGNVTSGIVNLITREGRNNVSGSFQAASEIPGQDDHAFDNAKRAEFGLGGPLTLGFGGPLLDSNYFLAGSASLTDTPYRQELRAHFRTPMVSNYDLSTKLMLRASNNLFLRGQLLLSSWEWRQYDPAWAGRSSALPKRLSDNWRLSLSLTHTLSPRMYYNFDVSVMDLHRQVRGEVPNDADANYRAASPTSLTAASPGALMPWQENLEERQITTRFGLVRQIHPHHQIKFGVETNFWSIEQNQARYLFWPADEAGNQNFVYSRYDDSFQHQPYQIAAYLHHKIELEGFLATFGARYEAFAPDARPTPLPGGVGLSITDSASIVEGANSLQQTLAPRLGLAIPIGEVEHLSFNYGWYYEWPPFFYLYFNRGGNFDATWPLFGNASLRPALSKAWEITYRRAISRRIVFSLTGFHRKSYDLIDTVPYTIASDLKGMQTFFRYENSGQASVSGFESAYRRQFGEAVTAGATYTYLRAHGTASWPESKLLSTSRNEFSASSTLSKPLAWNQQHTFTLHLAYTSKQGHLVSLFSKLNGPSQSVEWLSGRTVDLGWRNYIDAKLVVPFHWLGLKLKPSLEVRNLTNIKHADPEPGGLDLNQPPVRFEEYFGRRLWVGISYN